MPTTPLKLTSPNMKGDAVKKAQQNLKKAKFYGGDIDGEFGERTAGSIINAKRELGYTEASATSLYDQVFEDYLLGKTPQGPDMLKRAEAYKKAQGDVNAKYAKAVDVALSKIGVAEDPPESNIVEFSKWYGVNGPWCAMFVTWCAVQAGSKSFVKGKTYSYCPNVLRDAQTKSNGLSITTTPVKGSVVLFDWQKDGVPDHIGLFIKWADKEKTSFYAVEGNTSSSEKGSQSNGGQVAQRLRYVKNIAAFVNWQ
jgi:peptidoglycan hydrolase-like protein with peptidoglycan-binding domain